MEKKKEKETNVFDLDSIRKSMESKLGEDNSALIADDFASLITFNTEREKTLKSREDEITKLKRDKETLISANGNLLQQISRESEEVLKPKVIEKEDKKPFNFRDMFDEKGNFKKKL